MKTGSDVILPSTSGPNTLHNPSEDQLSRYHTALEEVIADMLYREGNAITIVCPWN